MAKKGFLGIPINRLVGVGAGAVAGKLINAPAKKMLAKYISDDPTTLNVREGRTGRLVLAGGKVLGGAYLQKQRSQFIKDAGFGLIAVGALELVEELAPNINLGGVGSYEDMERVGEVVEIDLDRLTGSGNKFDQRLENYQEVAGRFTDEYMEEEMELAGYEMY